jgi:serine O-acetyltransferase
LGLFATDLARWGIPPESPEQLFNRLQLSLSLQATLFYRVSHQLYISGISFWPDVLSTASRILSGVEVYYSADIGSGLKLIHGVGTVIGAKSRIGRNFTVFQGVTIGDKLGAETGGRPQIGDDVILSAGAQVLGPVTIGSKTIVGANAVVIRSTPGRCVVAGVPAELKAKGLSDERFNEFVRAIKG